MCVNTKSIYNRFIRQSFRVDCGNCEACRQKKAMLRANRIRNNHSSDVMPLFVTLTYTNTCVPYYRLKDFKPGQDLPVYRDVVVRRSPKDGRLIEKYERKLLFTIQGSQLDDTFTSRYPNQLNGKNGCVGLCYYKDVQNFFKLLRINLQRHYNINDKFTFFACSEYGGHSQRPHYHALIFIKPHQEKAFRSAISETWSYGNRYDNGRFIEVAKDAASYVSSYLSSSNTLPKILTLDDTRQKHSYSHHFGMANGSFALSDILEKTDRGDLSFGKQICKDGIPTIASVPVPKYVINRYFPQFKGYSRIPPSEVVQCISCPSRLYSFRDELEYTKEDIHKISTRLFNASQYYIKQTGKTIYDFAIDFERVWRCRKSTTLRFWYDQIKCNQDYAEAYDNLNDVYIRDLKTNLDDIDFIVTSWNPNEFKWRKQQTETYATLYRKMDKQRKVTNYCMAEMGLNV